MADYPEWESFYRINDSEYEFEKSEIPQAVGDLLRNDCPVIHISWEMRNANDSLSRLHPSQLSALADIRSKYADQPEIVRDFERVLGVPQTKESNS